MRCRCFLPRHQPQIQERPAVPTGEELSHNVATFRKNAAHVFFSSLARVIIFMLWLLLGLPAVTETDLSNTNIRTTDIEAELDAV